MKRTFRSGRFSARWLTLLLLAAVPLAFAQQHSHDAGSHAPAAPQKPDAADVRQVVAFPRPLKEHELASMRDHLLALSEIQGFLAKYEFDRASDLAEKRLGMSSFGLHGAHEVAPYMPKGMQEAGTAMHHAASQFAIAAQDAAVDHDLSRALAALNRVTQSCIACHAAYRLE